MMKLRFPRYDHAAEVAILEAYHLRQGRGDGGGGSGADAGAARSTAAADAADAAAGSGAATPAMDEWVACDVARMSVEITSKLAKYGLSDAKVFLDRISAAMGEGQGAAESNVESDEQRGEMREDIRRPLKGQAEEGAGDGGER